MLLMWKRTKPKDVFRVVSFYAHCFCLSFHSYCYGFDYFSIHLNYPVFDRYLGGIAGYFLVFSKAYSSILIESDKNVSWLELQVGSPR